MAIIANTAVLATLRAPLAATALALALAATTQSVAVAAQESPQFEALKPGRFVVHRQRVPVRVVLIGFDEGQVDEDVLRSWLPRTYRPLVRYPQYYGLDGRNMGLQYDFAYRIVRKSRHFSDRFFAHLAAIGTEGEPTEYQQRYNAQLKNVLDIAGPVLYIDAPEVEAWLEQADGQSQARAYTVYFVNWYGRDDFRFHVYTRTDDPDPDTKFNFGGLDNTAMTAWGGTSSRSWFYDFSAGPEWNTVNWLVDATDVDGDGFEEYRMPPIWEYATGGYRPADGLSGDMGLLTRFVAIDLLFTSSPLYDPMVTAPDAGGAKVAQLSMFEDDAAARGKKFLDLALTRKKFRSLQPYYRWMFGFREFDPIDAGSKLSLDIFAGNSDDPGCWEPIGTPFAQLFCYYDANLSKYVPAQRERDYVGELFAFNTSDAGLGQWVGLFGFADDNWTDGTQTYEFIFSADSYREAGFGFTSTVIHEFGHHIGLSHPHDGYDSEFDFDYGAGGQFYFAWVGDESDTVMQYIAVSNGFGTHNADNMRRWETAGYLNWANALTGDILESGRSSRVRAALERADGAAGEARAAFRNWNYLRSATKAREAYVILARAAEGIGVTSDRLTAARMPLPGSAPLKEGCRPKLLQELLQNQSRR